MSWSKLKNIIILILLTLNLFLLGLTGMIQLRAARYQEMAVSEAAAVLEKNNIHVDRETLPTEMGLKALVLTRDIQREDALAAALLGESAETTPSGGGVYLYECSAGTAIFRGNGEFSVTLSQPRDLETYGGAVGYARTLLEMLGLELWQAEETEHGAQASQRMEGTPVFVGTSASGVVFTCDDEGRLTSVSGRLLLGKSSPDPEGTQPVTVSTALISFFRFVTDHGDMCRTIYSITPVYRTVSTADPVRLAPFWLLSTDTGDYFLDACTTEVTRASAE